MGHVVAPQVQFVRDAFGCQSARQDSRAFRPFVRALARQDMNVLFLAQHRPVVVVVQIRQVRERVVEVDVLVIVAVGKIANAVVATHGDHAVEQVRAPEQLVGAVIGAEACAAGDDALPSLQAVPDVRDNFFADVTIILHLANRAVARVDVAVEPGLAVDAVDREDLDFAGLDGIRDRADQVKALILQVVGCGGGEQ